jgi:hypothetical protein
MSNLSEANRAALLLITEGDDLSSLTPQQAFAYGVATGLSLVEAPPPHMVAGDYQEVVRPQVDDCAIEVQEAMGWEPSV